MCILYAGIYRVALRLQRQAEAKHRAARAALLPYWSISRIRRTAPVWTILVATFPAVKTRSEAKHQRRAAMLMSAAGGAVGKVAVEVTHPVGGCRHFRFRSVEVTHQQQQQQQQGTTLAAVVAADQHNSTQQQNDGVAVGGGGGEGTANNVADVQSPPPPVVSPTPNRKKERRRPHDKRSKKRHQQHDHHDDDDDSSSLAFSSDSEPGDVDHRRGSGRRRPPPRLGAGAGCCRGGAGAEFQGARQNVEKDSTASDAPHVAGRRRRARRAVYRRTAPDRRSRRHPPTGSGNADEHVQRFRLLGQAAAVRRRGNIVGGSGARRLRRFRGGSTSVALPTGPPVRVRGVAASVAAAVAGLGSASGGRCVPTERRRQRRRRVRRR